MTTSETPLRAGRRLQENDPDGRTGDHGRTGTQASTPQSQDVQTESQHVSGGIFFEEGICRKSSDKSSNDRYTRFANIADDRPVRPGKTDDRALESGSLGTWDLFWIVPCIGLVWMWMALCDLVMGTIELFDAARSPTRAVTARNRPLA